ncbi:hypothetical protein [Psychrobacter frigidicola]|nr:hypothetical protein [Psychrobacter frigidicola]
MNKNVLIGLMSLLLISCSYFEKDKGKIIINNESADLVSKVRIEYTSAKRVDLIGELPPNSSYKYAIEYTTFEDSIYIYYTDKDKKVHSENVVPYAATYNKERYIFNIK